MSPYSSAPHEQNIRLRRGRNPIKYEQNNFSSIEMQT
jgi:hypothetical protein